MKFGLDENIIDKIIQVFEANSKVDKALVFGSRTKGNYRPNSDIDIVVKGYDLTLDDIIKMNVAFEEKGINYKIDLIEYKSIKKKALVEHIDMMGIEIYRRWKEYKLTETSEISTGFAFKGDKYESTGNLKVVRGENVTIGTLRWDSEKHWNKSTVGLEKYFIKEDDIVIGMDGSRVGYNRAIIRKEELPLILAQRVARLRAKKGFDQKYLWYNIFSNQFKDYVESIHTGTSIPHISQSQIGDFEIMAPSESEQSFIANILSSFDSKIDLLHIQNKTLEQLAETLFRQWFIEEAESKESITLNKFAQNIKKNAKVEDLQGFDYYVGLDHISKKSIALFNFGKPDELESNKSVFEENDILFGKLRSYFHKVVFAPISGVCSTDILVIRPKEKEWFSFCLFWFFNKDLVEFSDLGSGGTRMPRTSWEILSSYKIPIPNYKKIKEFDEIVRPMTKKITFNIFQIRALTQLRDTLLPKLMCGEVKMKI